MKWRMWLIPFCETDNLKIITHSRTEKRKWGHHGGSVG